MLQNLSQGTLTLASQVPFYDTTNGADRRASMADLAALVLAQSSSGDGFITQYESPTATGFSVTVSPFVAGGSVFLLITPAADYASGTVVLPAGAVHGQKVQVHSTQSVAALTVSGNGAAAVSGAPTALTDGSFFTMRYDGVTRGWYRVA